MHSVKRKRQTVSRGLKDPEGGGKTRERDKRQETRRDKRKRQETREDETKEDETREKTIDKMTKSKRRKHYKQLYTSYGCSYTCPETTGARLVVGLRGRQEGDQKIKKSGGRAVRNHRDK